MGDTNRQSFAAIASVMRAEFISYREAVTKLASISGDALADVATVLKLHRIHKNDTAHLRGVERRVHAVDCSDLLEILLNKTIETGQVEPTASGDGDGLSDMCGWMRDRFCVALEAAHLPSLDGLAVPEAKNDVTEERSASTLPAAAEASTPEWAASYIEREWISLGDAAAILAGFSPADTYRWGGDERVPINQRRNILRRSIRRYVYGQTIGSIRSKDAICDEAWVSTVRPWHRVLEEEKLDLFQGDIRTWCKRHGYHWPIPAPTSTPASNSELLTRLREAEAERDALRDIKAERDALRHELTQRAIEASNRLVRWLEQADSHKKQLDEANQEFTRLSSRLVGKNQEIARLERAIVRNATLAAGAQERLEEQLAIARSGMLAAQPPKGQISIQASGEGTTTPNVALGTRGKRSWSDKDLLVLLARVESGATHEALAAELGCTRQNVGRLLNKAKRARKKPSSTWHP